MTLQDLPEEALLLLYANSILQRDYVIHHSGNFDWDEYNRISAECEDVHDELMRRLLKP